MRTGVQEINFVGITGETVTLDVKDTSVFEYRITINTSSQITGAKAIAFTGSAFSGCMMVFNVIGGINTAGASKFTINGDPVPDVNALRPCMIYYRFNGSTWDRQILGSAGGSPFIPGSDLVDGSVPADKLENDIAGDGIARDGNGGVIPNLEAVQPSLQVVATELGVKLDPSRAVTKDSNGIGVKLEASNPSLQIATNELGVKIAANGGLEKTTSGMEVKIDPAGSTLVKGVNGVRGTNKRTIYLIASFEAEHMSGLAYQVRVSDASKIVAVRGSVWSEISAADDGDIQLYASTSFGIPGVALNTPYVIPDSSPNGTAVITDISEYIPSGYDGLGGWYLGVSTTKATPGGAVYLSIDIEIV